MGAVARSSPKSLHDTLKDVRETAGTVLFWMILAGGFVPILVGAVYAYFFKS